MESELLSLISKFNRVKLYLHDFLIDICKLMDKSTDQTREDVFNRAIDMLSIRGDSLDEIYRVADPEYCNVGNDVDHLIYRLDAYVSCSNANISNRMRKLILDTAVEMLKDVYGETFPNNYKNDPIRKISLIEEILKKT